MSFCNHSDDDDNKLEDTIDIGVDHQERLVGDTEAPPPAMEGENKNTDVAEDNEDVSYDNDEDLDGVRQAADSPYCEVRQPAGPYELVEENHYEISQPDFHAYLNDVEHKTIEEPFPNPSAYLFESLQLFREASDNARTASMNEYHDILLQAEVTSKKEKCSVDRVVERTDPTWNKKKWYLVSINDRSFAPGDNIKLPGMIEIVCNSIQDGINYNDTYIYNKTDNQFAKYNQRITTTMTHSGDVTMQNYLTHIISFEKPSKSTDYYVMSAPWKDFKCRPINTLTETRPVLEIRNENGANKQRFVVPQDFTTTDNLKTAFITTHIHYDHSDESWEITIKNDFITGFADDIINTIADINDLYPNN